MRHQYRLNFGQGQVAYPGSLKLCREWEKDYPGSFIEKREPDTGEWFPLSDY